MKLLSVVLVALYAALNLFLAVAGMFLHRDTASPSNRTLPCLLFLLSALLLVTGLWRQAGGWLLAGLLLASVAPVLYGALVEHSNVLLHHVVRAAVAIAIGICWLLTHDAG